MANASEDKTLIGAREERLYNTDLLLICSALLITGAMLNGITALYQAAVCLLSGIISEYIGFYLILKRKSFKNLSALTSSLMIALLLPASAPLYIGAAASAFAVLIAKLPFGDSRNAPFMPAAAGFCFAALMFPEGVFTYPLTTGSAQAVLMTSPDFIAGVTLTDMIKNGDSIMLNAFGLSALASGTFSGAIGTTSLIALIGAAVYQLIRRPSGLIATAGYLMPFCLFALMLPRTNAGIPASLIMELASGSSIFVALLMINSPLQCPRRTSEGFLYAFAAGLIAVLLNRYAYIYEGDVFSVLIINCLWPAFFSRRAPRVKRRAKQ